MPGNGITWPSTQEEEVEMWSQRVDEGIVWVRLAPRVDARLLRADG